MNPAIASKGKSFKGAVRYITHDIGENTADRVVETRTLNLRTDDPEKAAKVMAWTAEHAADLKRAAGIPATGAKTKDPVYHFALTWEPSQRPGFEEMVSAAQSALKELGFEKHEAVLAAHNDKAHAHIHVVVSRIDPETGRAVNPNKDYERLQRWAWQYEKEHGYIYCLDRALRYEKDPSIRAELTKRKALEQERGSSAESKPRPQWDAERDTPYPKSKAAGELRAELAEKAKAIATDGRAQAARQKEESTRLWDTYQAHKAALWERQRDEYKAETRAALKVQTAAMQRMFNHERGEQREQHQAEWGAFTQRYRDRERAQIDQLFRTQRQEFRDFLQTSHRGGFLGAIATAIQAARHAQHDGSGRGFVVDMARFFALAINADARATTFLEGQKNERERLRHQIRRQVAPTRQHEAAALKLRQETERKTLWERQNARRREEEQLARTTPGHVRVTEAVRARHTDERQRLRASYVEQKAAMVDRHGKEREALKARWAALNAERRAAWGDYRRGRLAAGEQARETGKARAGAGLRPHFPGGARDKDAGRSVGGTRRADAGRGPSRGSGRGGPTPS